MWRTMCSGGRGLIPLCAALLIACGGELPSKQPGTVLPPTPLCTASDPAQVVAPQRILLLTSTQLMNMIRLVSDDAARAVVDGGVFSVISDLNVRFPPARVEQYKTILDVDSLAVFSNTAQKVGEYVRDHFADVTTCSSPATDGCATRYLDALAGKAYRRPLTADEQARFTALYDSLRTAVVKDQAITLTVEEATGFAVQALLLSPQLLWRWEVGAEMSSSPPGVFLTDAELASNLSFFLTDGPPDDALRADASAGTLRANLGAHVDRILATPAARQWLTHLMQTYFLLNVLPATTIDETQFPIVAGGALYADLYQESQLFLGDVMWNGKVTDLLTSRKAFLNSNLASMIYGVPVPTGATATHFTETMLPADERAGMLTDAGFLTTRARTSGVGLVPRRPRRQGVVHVRRDAGPAGHAGGAEQPHRRWQPGRADRTAAGGLPGSDARMRHVPRVVQSLRPRARLVRRGRPLPDERRPRQAGRWAHEAAGGGRRCRDRYRGGAGGPALEERRVHQLPGEVRARRRAGRRLRWSFPSPLTSKRAARPPAWRTTCDGARANRSPTCFAPPRPHPRSCCARSSRWPPTTTRPPKRGRASWPRRRRCRATRCSRTSRRAGPCSISSRRSSMGCEGCVRPTCGRSSTITTMPS